MDIEMINPKSSYIVRNLAHLEPATIFCIASHKIEKIMKNENNVAIYMKVDCANNVDNFKSGTYAINLRNGNLYRFTGADALRDCYVIDAKMLANLKLQY